MSYWINSKKIISKEYTCGYCGSNIASEKGYYTTSTAYTDNYSFEGFIYICHKCNKPTFFDHYEKQTPGTVYGKEYEENIFPDKNTYELYEEIRNCMMASCYTSTVLSARKLLMHIGVDCGAEKGKTFEFYVNYLNDNGYISKNCKKWVDLIRTKGNEANHEIQIFNENEAKQIVKFVEIMISVIYEMPNDANSFESE